ncbi:MFS transporter [Salipaludibacillus agaradhaerens]|uniref:MFS transporter n=1 Tax=Salipaludibacillus agaradhaerens TaxID=76935 RepID=UPI002151809C|nr:MFS transporter [Salipaludibacillus agaradhaerens]MCR6117505.1 MFS transporter [Salipaludibacillus agaradhaerens]UJW56694.1 MFS transporter [Bacillus sp. A116_S68]
MSLANLEEKTKLKERQVWKNKNFLFLLLGHSAHNFTFHIFALSIPLIIYDLTSSSFYMGTMKAIEFIPNVVLGILIGVLIDWFNRKRIMLLSILIKIFSVIFIILLLATSTIQLWHLYLLGFFIYTCIYAFANTYQSIIPSIVDKSQLTTANAYITFTNTIFNSIGPAMAGAIILYTTYVVGLSITLLGLIVLLVCVLPVKLPSYEPRSHFNLKKDIIEGWTQLYGSKALFSATLLILGNNIASVSTSTILIFYALDVIGITEGQLGLIFSISAIGGVVATLIAKYSKDYVNRGYIFILATFTVSLAQFAIFLSSNWYVICMSMFFVGFSATICNVHYFALRQESTPSHLLGRVIGTSSMIMKLALPFSFLVITYLADIIEVNLIFLMTSMFLLIITILALRTRLTDLK